MYVKDKLMDQGEPRFNIQKFIKAEQDIIILILHLMKLAYVYCEGWKIEKLAMFQ